jgi:YVTN family beta-propeller protein
MLSLGRLRRQAALLDRYCAVLRRDRAATPPEGLDPELAVVARAVEQERNLSQAPSRFRADLWNQLEAQGGTRVWTGPVIGPNNRHRTPVRETEEQTLMTASTEQPASLEERRWAKELWKIAAAVIAFAAVGALLVLVLRDNGDKAPSIVGPGPTPTLVSSPSSNVTATINPTRAAAIAMLTATAIVRAGEQTATVSSLATANASLPPAGEIVATIPVGAGPQGLAATDDAIWVANSDGGTVSRIDPATNAVVATVTLGPVRGSGPNGSPLFISTFNDQVWVSNNAESALVRIDPATNEVVQTISLVNVGDSGTFFPRGLLVDASGLWTSDGKAVVAHIDPATGAVLATFDIELPYSIVSGYGSVWVATGEEGPHAIVRIDPTNNQIVSQTAVAGSSFFMAAGAGAIWVTDGNSGVVTRIDPTTNTVVATIDTGLDASNVIVVAQSGVWVANFGYGVVRIDPNTNEPSRIIDETNNLIFGIVELDGSIWVAHSQKDEVVRIDPAP